MPPTVTSIPADMRVSNREEDSVNLEPSMSGKSIVGLIFPPPDIRTIVDKTAAFTARNGIEFENKIKEKEANNPKFNFLSNTDPYHAYYQNKVKEFQTGVTTAPLPAHKPQLPEAVREAVKQAEFIPKNPPKPYEFMADPSTINAFDLDLIRLTALFVARNGRQFLTQLMNREVRNYQFDFLKPQHSNFPYFTKLVEQYTKVILPPKDILNELAENSTHQKIMDDVRYRVGWEKHQKAVKDREEAEVEKERLAYSSIDWHDFVVVQTVDFQVTETLNLPPLCTPKDVGTRILMQQRDDAAKAATETEEMEMESESDEEEEGQVHKETHEARIAHEIDVPSSKQHAPYQVTQPTPAPPTAGNVVIREYDPKKAQKPKLPSEKYIISPLTGERIPAEKLQEHLRYSTVDPQYKEQRDRELMERQDEDPTNASGTEISRNIAKLAERRTDIFGVGAQGAEQTIIGKKLGEEDRTFQKDSRTIWDGQQSTIDQTTKLAQQQITIEQQIQEIHRQHGFTADTNKGLGPKPMPGSVPSLLPPARPPLPPPVQAPPPRPPPPATNVGKILTVTPNPPLLPPPPLMHPPPPNPFLPPSAMPPRPAYGMPPPGMMQYREQREDDGPSAKRSRLEEDLEPEGVWLQRVQGIITVNVQTLQSDEWKLENRTIPIGLDVSSPVSALKSLIQEQTGVPTTKIKLSYEGIFLKDQLSLAYYNMNNGSNVQIQMKERGGRKK